MRRIYFLLPDIERTRQIVDELLLARIEEHHIHIIAKEGVSMENLPEASFLQKSDFVPALERGLAVGFTRYAGMNWRPFKGWAVSAGDNTVCVMGNLGVFVETAKADFNAIYKTLGEEASVL